MDLKYHLRERYIDLNVHRAWFNYENVSVTFPLWNLTGQLVGYQRYRPLANKEKKNDPREGRYFTRASKDTIRFWGLESWTYSPVIFVCEGLFDAARFTWLGYSAIATLSDNPSPEHRLWLYNVRKFRKLVSVCDSGDAGRNLARLGHESFVFKTGDAGAAPDEQIEEIIKRYI